jgi:hypothetical protein
MTMLFSAPSRRLPARGRGCGALQVLMGLALSLLATGSALAQVTADTVRALNTARDTAVNLNGGLAAYQPAACMVQTGEGGGDCLVRADNQGFLFQFLGGVPGWQEENIAPR